MYINASWGLGEAIVSGEVSPDQWVVDKNTCAIVKADISKKHGQSIRVNGESGQITILN